MPSYRIVEIFENLQGEGFNTGMPAIFIRFGKCNLACPWCDTDYQTFSRYTLKQILTEISQYTAKNVIITGGEPTIQANLDPLLTELKQRGFFITIESNGLREIPSLIDFISLSPKAMYAEKYLASPVTRANEVRIVVDHSKIYDFCQQIEKHIQADHYFLSPCESHAEFNLQETIALLGQLNQRGKGYPHWLLSLQTHKLIGIR